MATEINRDKFLGLSFSHHMEILHKTKNIDEVLFCIHEAVTHQWDKYTLRNILILYQYDAKESEAVPSDFDTASSLFMLRELL